MTNQITMKAVVATRYGGPEVYKIAELPKPTPKPNEILVRVKAASATTADSMIRTGKPYFGRLFIGFRKPRKATPGTGFAGIIESLGAEVDAFKIGDRVFGETLFNFSSNAEYICVPANGVVLKMPQNLQFAEAASFCDGHLTSYNFLSNIVALKKGDKVLINGASGSLGVSAIQIAKYFGAEVTAVCSQRNIGLVESLGADHTINYQSQDFTQSNDKYDFIYDTIGKSSFKKTKAILKPNGKYLSPVLNFPLLVQMLLTSLKGGKKAIFEATGSNKPAKLKTMLKGVMDVYKTGKLKTVIDRQFPLEKIAEAHRYIDTGRKRGSIALINE
ncbi:MAG: NAD(P)-dependent alcohol dehydrogenase [Bacteroidia bacterium]